MHPQPGDGGSTPNEAFEAEKQVSDMKISDLTRRLEMS